MAAARTFGMTLIASLSLVVGVMGVVGSASMVSDGLGLTRFGSATSAPTVGTSGAPPPAGAGSVPVVIFGAARGVLSVVLLAGAIGTLGVRPAGRRCSLIFAAGWIVLGIVEPLALGYVFGWPVVVSALYPFLLLAMYSRPAWRRAFAPARAAPPGRNAP